MGELGRARTPVWSKYVKGVFKKSKLPWHGDQMRLRSCGDKAAPADRPICGLGVKVINRRIREKWLVGTPNTLVWVHGVY